MREGCNVMANRLPKTDYGTLPLRGIVAVLPFSILLHFWPNHKSAALSVGLGLGVICSYLIPPRSPIRWMLVVLVVVVILGAVLPTLNWPR
jgi:hypothetical protein